MITKPKARKTPAAKPATEGAWRPHRAVVLTIQQRDEMDNILHLIQAAEIAIQGTELGDYDRGALFALARVVEGRLTALAEEFDAFAKAEAA